MMKPFLIALSILLSLYICQAQPDIDVNEFATGFDRPVNIKNAGDDRLFIVEQEGVIKILNADGTTNPTPFLDIQADVGNIGAIGDERGLLGLVFHPNYGTNGFFYVNYINNSGNTEIVRFTVDSGNPNIADASSGLVILTINQPFPNHNGGDMAFGADGFLYIATGDGGSGGDPGNRAQNLNTLLGKILRIDVDGGSPYAIPGDNPFLNDGDDNTLPEIWAYGLRNPWKISFDTTTNDLWIGDVGQGEFEEINRANFDDAGLNYGWRCYEGNAAFNTAGCPADSELTFPVGVYSHFVGAFKCSVVGGYRYNGNEYANFNDLYFFADYCSAEIGYLEQNGNSWDLTLTTVSAGNSWSAFGETIAGELVIADLDSGIIYNLVDNNLSVETFEQTNFKMFPNPANFEVEFVFDQIPQHLTIFNFNGQLIDTVPINDEGTLKLPTLKYSSGIYFVKANFANGKTTAKKLVIQ